MASKRKNATKQKPLAVAAPALFEDPKPADVPYAVRHDARRVPGAGAAAEDRRQTSPSCNPAR